MNSPEVYMNSARDDEEMEHDIQEFMSVILEEEDETEYTDYRKYFTYDMKILSRAGKPGDRDGSVEKAGLCKQWREADAVFYHSGGKPAPVLSEAGLLRETGLY